MKPTDDFSETWQGSLLGAIIFFGIAAAVYQAIDMFERPQGWDTLPCVLYIPYVVLGKWGTTLLWALPGLVLICLSVQQFRARKTWSAKPAAATAGQVRLREPRPRILSRIEEALAILRRNMIEPEDFWNKIADALEGESVTEVLDELPDDQKSELWAAYERHRYSMSAIEDASLRTCLDEWCRHERNRTVTQVQTALPSTAAMWISRSEQIKRDGEFRPETQ